MSDYKDLEEFGFEPEVTTEKKETVEDFSNFGFEPELPEEEEMGILEAIGIKIPQGITLGTSPVFAGIQKGAEVLEDIFSPSGAPATYKGVPMGKPKDPEKIERYETLSDAVKAAKDKYYQGKEERIALEEKAQEEYPYVSLGTEIISSIPTTGGLGALANVASKGGKIAKIASKFLPQTKNMQKASALTKAGVYALEGAGMGGLQGLTRGEARLLEGDLLGTLQETAEGATTGAAAGVLLPAAGSAIKQTAKLTGKGIKALPGVKAFKTGYKAGEKGINILEDKEIQNFVKSESTKIKETIGSLFGKEKKDDLLKKYDDEGLVANIKDIIEEAKDELSKGSYSKEGTKQVNDLINELTEIDINFDSVKQKALAKAEKQQAAKINKLAREGAEVDTRTEFDTDFEDLSPLPETKGRVIGVEDRIKIPNKGEKKIISQVSTQEDKIPLRQIDLENAKISEIENYRDSLYNYTNPKEFKSEVNKIAKNIRKKLAEVIDDSLKSTQFSEKRRQSNNILNSFDRLGIDKNKFNSKNPVHQQEVIEKITQAVEANPNSPKGRAFSDAMGFLKTVDESKVADIEKKSDFLNNLSQFAKQSDAEGTVDITRAVIGAAQKGLGKVGNVAGFAKKAVGKEISQAKSALISVIKESTPENLQNLAEELYTKYGKTSIKYVNQLNKIASLPSSRRNSYVFALMQDKAFKQMLKNIGMQEAQASEDISEFMQGEQNENDTDVNMSSDVSGNELKKKVENTREPSSVEQEIVTSNLENEYEGSLQKPSLLAESNKEDVVSEAGNNINLSAKIKRDYNIEEANNLIKSQIEQNTSKGRETIKKLQELVGTNTDGYFFRKDGKDSNSQKSLLSYEGDLDRLNEIIDIKDEIRQGMSQKQAIQDRLQKLNQLISEYRLEKSGASKSTFKPEGSKYTSYNSDMEGYIKSSEGLNPVVNLGNADILVTGMDKEAGHGRKSLIKYYDLSNNKINTFKDTTMNLGLDFVNKDGSSEIKSMIGGQIVFSGVDPNSKGHGNSVFIESPKTINIEGKSYKIFAAYGHNNAITAKKGDNVNTGDVVSIIGNSGGNYATHGDIRTFLIPESEVQNFKTSLDNNEKSKIQKIYVNPIQLKNYLENSEDYNYYRDYNKA